MYVNAFQSSMKGEKTISYTQADHFEIAEKSFGRLNMGISACHRSGDRRKIAFYTKFVAYKK